MAMSNRFSTSSSPNESSSRYFSTEDNRAMRLMEMHRRLKTLQAKRFHLRHELEIVEKYLVSLDSQIKGLESYQHLSWDRTCNRFD